MGKMFDHYRMMFGDAVKGGENAPYLNGPCPFCGGHDRFTCMTRHVISVCPAK